MGKGLKKRLKKTVSLIMSFVIVGTTVFTASSCGFKREVTTLTMGQWLMLLDTSFGMNSSSSTEPYFDNVDSNNPYYAAVQIAADWDVVDPSKEMDVDAKLTWNDALVTLVNAGRFVGLEESDDKKVDYAIANFDSSIRKYWMEREIDVQEAVELLSTAQNQWANISYDENIEEVKYNDNVVDLTGDASVVDDYTIEGNIVTIDNNPELDLEVGDVYMVPNKEHPYKADAYKIEAIEKVGDQWVITNSEEELDLYDIAEDINIQETIAATETNMILYDADGMVVPSEGNMLSQIAANNQKEYSAQNLDCTVGDYQAKQTSAKGSKTFEINGTKLTVDLGLSKGKVSVSGTIERGKGKLNISESISNISAVNEIDYSLFQLKSAKTLVNYDTEFTVKASYSNKLADRVYAPTQHQKFGQGQWIKNLKDASWKNVGDPGSPTIKGEMKEDFVVKIGSVEIWSAGLVCICLDITFQLKFDGSFTIKVSTKNSKGVEYYNNNFRFINVEDKDVDVIIAAKLEAVFGIGPNLYMKGLKKSLLGFTVQAGVGTNLSVTFHLADSQNHLIEELADPNVPADQAEAVMEANISTDVETMKEIAKSQGGTFETETSGDVKLHCDVCFDITAYGILRIELTKSSYLGEILDKTSIKLSLEILGEKNAKFANAHLENGEWVNAGWFGNAQSNNCTMKYKKFDSAEPDTETETETDTDFENSEIEPIIAGAVILSEVKVTMVPGEYHMIAVTGLPGGYTLNDIKASSSDTSVVTVDSDGKLHAVGPGVAIVIYQTSDGHYAGFCAVTVNDPYDVEYEGI